MSTSEVLAAAGVERKVLIVDDEPHILSAIQDLLEDDFAVLAVTDARMALRLLEEEEVAVILSDQRMPGLSGDQFLREAQKRSRATRVLITGYADLRALISAVNEGKIYGYVAKPWEPEELHSLVSKAADYFALVQDLEQERALLHTLMDHIPDHIYFKDTAARFTRINSAMARALGLRDPREAIGKTEADLLPEAARQFYEDERRIIELAQPLVDQVEEVRGEGGKNCWYSTTKVPLRDKQGTITGLVGISRDVTERQCLEAQLRQAQKLEAVGRLAGGIAHDFNNLLTIIDGYSALQLRRMSADQPQYESLREIQRAADRGAGLIRQLLAFSRKQVLEPKVLDLNTVVKDLEKMLHRLIGEDVELVVRLAPGLGQVKADPGQVEQVLMNLAINARDAMPRGGTLLIETRSVELDEGYTSHHVPVEPGAYVLLEVSDTGVGMDEATQARIFEPFFTTKEAGKGTGLGLSTVYGIVKQSEGYIWVYSEPDKGTSFKIYLPQIAASTEPVAQKAALQIPRGSEAVLLVEDEKALRNLIGLLLREEGYTVLEAGDGQEALRLSAQHQGAIHLIVTDMVLPGMSGRDLVGQLIALRPELKTVYISGYSEEIISRQGALEPGTAFLQKPFKFEALLLKVREVLDS
ncbi:MAG: response regulator [Candidatus Latescibacteria bacterium]|nr:response regulator [Candidatus Latescibacterota bacterium]